MTSQKSASSTYARLAHRDRKYGKHRNQSRPRPVGKKGAKSKVFYVHTLVCGFMKSFMIRALTIEDIAAVAEYKAENYAKSHGELSQVPFTFEILSCK